MPTKQIPKFAGAYQGDSDNLPDAFVERDANGDIHGEVLHGEGGLLSDGHLKLPHVTKTGAYTATAFDYLILCDASGGAFTVTLPAAAGANKQIIVVKKIDSSGNAVTVDGNGAETIDGAATKALATQWKFAVFQGNGVAWFIIGVN